MMRSLAAKALGMLVVLCCTTATVAAQDVWRAKIKLHQSPTLRGYVSTPLEGDHVYLQQADSTQILLELSDIKKIKLVNRHNKVDASLASYPLFACHAGFYHQIFVGAAFGEEEVNGSLGIENGYRFNKLFALGLGLGYDRYENMSALPVYVQPRLYLKNGKVSIYYFTGLGYSPAWRNKAQTNAFEKIEVKGGLMGRAGIAYQINFLKSALNFSLGYKLQKVETDYEYFSQSHDRWRLYEPVKTMDIVEKRVVRRVFFAVGYTL